MRMLLLSHNRKIHLLAIDPSLEDYQHLHPAPDSLFKGIWRFTLTPKKSGKYKVYLDLIPLRSPQGMLGASFIVPGTASIISPRSDGSIISKNNRVFTLETIDKDDSVSEMQLKFSALDEKGNQLPLRPVMGAFAHLVAFEPGTDGFAHLHLWNMSPLNQKKIVEGPLTFSFKSPKSGIYRLWAQIRVDEDEEESFLPFDIRI